MTPAERALLLALFRWAWGAGWINVGYRNAPIWRNPSGGPWVGMQKDHPGVIGVVGNEGEESYRAASISQAVDILAALDIIPARFSTAYAAGWYAALSEDTLPGAEPDALPMAPA